MSLLRSIARKENLFRAWSLLKKNPNSYGIDQETIQLFQDNLYPKISTINSRLRNGTYRFAKYRGHILKERNKKPRPLLIPTVADRVVQKAIINIIGRKVYPCFCGCSYGYIEGRGIQEAVKQIVAYKNEGYFYVLEADIQKFFDTVNRKQLFEAVIDKLKKDKSINLLLEDALNAEIGNPEIFKYQDIEFFNNHEIGIPQGGVLSPLFANIYLTDFDKKMIGARYKLVRYADDFIVLCKTEKEALSAYSLCKDILEKQLKLKMHPLSKIADAKTKISDFKKGFRYLGIQFTLHDILPVRMSVDEFRLKVNELTNYNSINILLDNLLKLSKLIYGWGNAYRFCRNKNTHQLFQSLDKLILKRVNTVLKKFGFLSKANNISNAQLKLLKIPKLIDFLI